MFSSATRLHQQGRLAEAISLYQQVLRGDRKNVGTANLLGVALMQAGRLEEAATAIRRALEIDPRQSTAHYNLGTILQSLNRHVEAADHYQRAIALSPDDVESHSNLGATLKALGRYEEAVASYRKALMLKSESAETRVNLASALFFLDRYEESLSVGEEALRLNPNLAEAHLGYGRSLGALHRAEESLWHIDKSLAIKPGQNQAIFSKAFICLSLERFSEGWRLYDTRFLEELKFVTPRAYSMARWDGKKIDGTLAVWGEQGLGDQILYASIIPDVRAHAGSVVLEVEPRLIPLFARSFPGVQFCSLAGDPKEIRADAHVPMGGLGEFFRQRPEDFPRQAYLVADKGRAAGLRASLHADKKIAVGISWRSANPKFGMHKTAQLRDFSPLFTRPDVQVVDLQYGDTAAEIEAVRGEFGAAVKHLDEIDNTNDIDGLAALIDACDVVLTVSNTTAHIAGALGKPVWVMVPHGQGRLWYWFHERADSPWYPEMRICRQQKGQSWADLIASAVSQIADFVQRRGPN